MKLYAKGKLIVFLMLCDLCFAAPTGIIAHWKLNGNAANSNVFESVLAVNDVMTLTGTGAINTSTVSAAGIINNSIDFGADGTVRYVNVGDVSVGSTITIKSISAWVFITGSVGIRCIVDLDTTGLGNQTPNMFFVETTTNAITTGAGFTGTEVLYVDGQVASVVATNGWHHVVMTETTGVAPVEVTIGGKHTDTEMIGRMDNVMLFDRVLTAHEVRLLYNTGKGTEVVTEMDTSRRYGRRNRTRYTK